MENRRAESSSWLNDLITRIPENASCTNVLEPDCFVFLNFLGTTLNDIIHIVNAERQQRSG